MLYEEKKWVQSDDSSLTPIKYSIFNILEINPLFYQIKCYYNDTKKIIIYIYCCHDYFKLFLIP